MRVLLVEDDPMIGKALQDALRDASYATDWVTDGLAALHAAASQRYDLVLLDLGLPGKDGLDVLRTIRGRDNAVPLLIITARDGLETRIQGLDGGADDYVLKPFAMTSTPPPVRPPATACRPFNCPTASSRCCRR